MVTSTEAQQDNGNRMVITRVTRTWLDDEGIVRVDCLSRTPSRRGRTPSSSSPRIREIAGPQERVLLADMRQTKSMDRGARTYYASAAIPGTLRAWRS